VVQASRARFGGAQEQDHRRRVASTPSRLTATLDASSSGIAKGDTPSWRRPTRRRLRRSRLDGPGRVVGRAVVRAPVLKSRLALRMGSYHHPGPAPTRFLRPAGPPRGCRSTKHRGGDGAFASRPHRAGENKVGACTSAIPFLRAAYDTALTVAPAAGRDHSTVEVASRRTPRRLAPAHRRAIDIHESDACYAARGLDYLPLPIR